MAESSSTRLAGRSSRLLKLSLLAGAMVLLTPCSAQAYIGPGAGFAVATSLLVMFMAVLSALCVFLTWPLRHLIRLIRGRRVFARSRARRVVILGLDGMDPGLTEKYLAEGWLPNLDALRRKGCYMHLATTLPAISPVAWSSFQTSSNPGKHNIFDFLTPDRRSYRPRLSSVDIRSPRRTLRLGKWTIPLSKPDIRLLRKGRPFWQLLGKAGIFSSVIRVPITFPPEKFHGVSLSGMCVPDLRGTQGMFSFYTTGAGDGEHTGGERIRVRRRGNTVRSELIGSPNPFRTDGRVLTCPFKVTIRDHASADLKLNGQRHRLTRGVYSDWITARFKAAPGLTVRGICKFLLLSAGHEFQMYVTPINIDPDKPAMPISHPSCYAAYLAKRQGPFATLGLAEDSWALNEGFIDDEQFIQQCVQADEERKAMFFDSLQKVPRGLCLCVFDGMDRIQHTFWRDLDARHPARQARPPRGERNAVRDLYQRMDGLVGETMARCDDDRTVLMVISDHGFSGFRYGVDLNRWLAENGYLKLKDGADLDEPHLAAVDFSRTRAFALGLAGIYLNLQGRESRGIVADGPEADELREEIAAKLVGLHDPLRNQPAVRRVYHAVKVYTGPYKTDAPDLILGFQRGYRASWETAVGRVTEKIFHDNLRAWSGDHCVDPSLVPGVLFCNRPIAAARPRLMDIGPTVLDLFGLDIPGHFDGVPLPVGQAGPTRADAAGAEGAPADAAPQA